MVSWGSLCGYSWSPTTCSRSLESEELEPATALHPHSSANARHYSGCGNSEISNWSRWDWLAWKYARELYIDGTFSTPWLWTRSGKGYDTLQLRKKSGFSSSKHFVQPCQVIASVSLVILLRMRFACARRDHASCFVGLSPF